MTFHNCQCIISVHVSCPRALSGEEINNNNIEKTNQKKNNDKPGGESFATQHDEYTPQIVRRYRYVNIILRLYIKKKAKTSSDMCYTVTLIAPILFHKTPVT